MTTSAQPTDGQPKGGEILAEEIPLEDIEKMLESEDPEFAKQLEEVRTIENDPTIELEASVVGEDDNLASEERPDSVYAKVRARVKMSVYTFKRNLKIRLKEFAKNLLIALKTKPAEFAYYTMAMAKLLLNHIGTPLRLFKAATPLQRLASLVLLVIGSVALLVLINNVKGIWIPALNEPILTSFEAHADFVESFTADQSQSFYGVFPQERHEFLFTRMKVNLRRTPDNPNPMGAFEVIVLLDSKDTAIEVRDREVELFDYLQRVFEDETFNDLENELGKAKLKSRLKRELNQLLTQGWVKEVSFKTFILKP